MAMSRIRPPRRPANYDALPSPVLAALVRALRRQGTRLATERDSAYHGLAEYEDGITKLLRVAAHQRKQIEAVEGQNIALKKQLESSLRWRRKLIARVRELTKTEGPHGPVNGKRTTDGLDQDR